MAKLDFAPEVTREGIGIRYPEEEQQECPPLPPYGTTDPLPISATKNEEDGLGAYRPMLVDRWDCNFCLLFNAERRCERDPATDAELCQNCQDPRMWGSEDWRCRYCCHVNPKLGRACGVCGTSAERGMKNFYQIESGQGGHTVWKIPEADWRENAYTADDWLCKCRAANGKRREACRRFHTGRLWGEVGQITK